MSNEVVTNEVEQGNSDSCADSFVAFAVICLFVTTVIFWISNQ